MLLKLRESLILLNKIVKEQTGTQQAFTMGQISELEKRIAEIERRDKYERLHSEFSSKVNRFLKLKSDSLDFEIVNYKNELIDLECDINTILLEIKNL